VTDHVGVWAHVGLRMASTAVGAAADSYLAGATERNIQLPFIRVGASWAAWSD
jgi:hypothetical protein